MTRDYEVELEGGAKCTVSVSDEPWKGELNVTDWTAVTPSLLRRVAYRKCGLPAPVAETARLFLRELSAADRPRLQRLGLSERERQFLGDDWTGLFEADFLAHYIRTQYTFFDCGLWAVFLRRKELREGEFLGLTGFSPAEPVELGFVLRREARGRGYAVEASLAALRYAVTELGLTEAQIRVQAENLAGYRTAKTIKEQWDSAGGALQCRLFVKREGFVYKE